MLIDWLIGRQYKYQDARGTTLSIGPYRQDVRYVTEPGHQCCRAASNASLNIRP